MQNLPEQLEPPATLHAPKPIQPIPLDKAEGMVPMEPKVVGALDVKVNDFIDQVLRADVNSEPFVNKVSAIHNLGNEEIRKAANVSNRLLDRPIQSVSSGFFDDKSPVSKALLDLRRTVEDLDPGRQNEGAFSPRRLFGRMPAGDKVRDYFLRYQSAQGHINAILTSLYRSQDELLKDNAAIEEEKVNLWGIMGRLQQYVYIGRKIDASLVTRIAEIEQTDPEKARVVKEEMLFYVRQKVQDLLTQLAVTIQGYLALDIVRKNNLELIKGVDRASTTTVSALRTAVIVAQALANQKLVLDQINALNATTGSVIESTSVLLKQQSTSVGQQAASSTINMEQLQRAFTNIYETMDMISTYKLEALDSMQITVNTLASEVRKSQTYLDRVRNAEVIEVTGGMRIVESETTDQPAQGGAAQAGAAAQPRPAAPPVDDGTVKI
jgi:uncharacterized protein YaaN involved in tellurite resistance